MAMLRIKKRYITLLLSVLLFLFASFYNSSYNTFIPRPTPTPTPKLNPSYAKATRVVDGDTIEIDTGQKVRYIGINTPEIHSPTKGVECFGKEASLKNKELVEGKMVRLEKDISETDKYGRFLRYVYIDDVFVNDLLVRSGYAQAATFPPDVRFSHDFKESERLARQENLGLWARCYDLNVLSPTNLVP